jgi:hypothetical protein
MLLLLVGVLLTSICSTHDLLLSGRGFLLGFSLHSDSTTCTVSPLSQHELLLVDFKADTTFFVYCYRSAEIGARARCHSLNYVIPSTHKKGGGSSQQSLTEEVFPLNG